MRTLKALFHVFLRRLVQAQTTARHRGFARVSALTFCALAFASSMPPTANAHEGEDHEAKKTEATTTKSNSTATKSSGATLVRAADRNVQTPDGQFRVHLRQSPADPRTGEEAQFAVEPSEQVEGGFGGSGTVPLEGAKINARVTTAGGQVIENNLPAHAEESGSYGVHYTFKSGGEYKIIFDVRTSDNRQFNADFPLSIVAAPVNWIFWLGLTVLLLLSAGAIFGYYNSWLGDGANIQTAARKTLPLAAGVLLFFVVGVIALAYFMPPRERRKVAGLTTTGGAVQTTKETTASGDPALGGSGAVLNISKESQLLFGIRTAPVELRQITSGLKVTGTVKTRPDAHAVVSPPVSGRIFLKQGINIGTVVGRGEQVGTVEQILGAPEQASLEGQRLGLRTAALEQQAKQAQQIALAQQARTRLAQAQRELRRAANLVEVGAASKRRVEEAQTAVRLAEQEVASAEQQARVAGQQAQLARVSVARVNPVRTFPLLAPVTGVVSNLQATTGQQVEAGANLMDIVNLSSVLLEANVFEKDLAIIRESRRAAYTAAGIPGEVYRIGQGGDGRLLTIGQSVDPQTHTVPVIFEVPNPLNRLREGMFVEITIDTTGSNTVLSVPKQAVITEQGRTFVYVFEGGEKFEKRVVVLGSEGQDFNEVKSGVQAGERVVVEGIYQLRSTQPGA